MSSEDQIYKDQEEEKDEAAYTLEELPNSMFELTMHVPCAFYKGLCNNTTLKDIGAKTHTEIYVPGRNTSKQNDKAVSIKGKSRDSVCAAHRKILSLMESLRKRMRPTHFLAVALTTAEIQEKFLELQKAILAEEFPGINEQLFMYEDCLHLTLGTYVLLNDAECNKALEILQTCRSYLDDLKTPFDIKIAGLKIMNAEPRSVHVLYGDVVAPDLQIFADRVSSPFRNCGFDLNHHKCDKVKLHMTLMNSRYGKKKNEKKSKSFDAREILKRFSSYEFGSAQCSEVQVCVMGTSHANGEKGYYKVIGSLKF